MNPALLPRVIPPTPGAMWALKIPGPDGKFRTQVLSEDNLSLARRVRHAAGAAIIIRLR